MENSTEKLNYIRINVEFEKATRTLDIPNSLLETNIFFRKYCNVENINEKKLNLDKLDFKFELKNLILAIRMESFDPDVIFHISNTYYVRRAKTMSVETVMVSQPKIKDYLDLYNLSLYFGFEFVKKIIKDNVIHITNGVLFSCRVDIKTTNNELPKKYILEMYANNFIIKKVIDELPIYVNLLKKCFEKEYSVKLLKDFEDKILESNDCCTFEIGNNYKFPVNFLSEYKKLPIDNYIIAGESLNELIEEKDNAKVKLDIYVYGTEQEIIKSILILEQLKNNNSKQNITIINSNSLTIKKIIFEKNINLFVKSCKLYATNIGFFRIMSSKI